MKPLKRLLVGDPLSTAMAHHERLDKKTALAVFSSDALSSVAYSTEAILLVLLAAGTLAIGYLIPIVIGIAVLLAILTLSYRQTIHAYPSGGGAYIVAKDNLGTLPGLIAGASLLVDYILTVAVSISAGIAAVLSATQGTRFEFLGEHRVALCLFMIMVIAWINLRGVKEAGAIFAGPTYLFIASMLILVVGGFIHLQATGAVMPTPPPDKLHFDGAKEVLNNGMLTGGALLWLLMRSFAAGCTALTGVEAISNGVPAFQPLESRNASVTLTWMAVIMTTLILGTGFLAYYLNAHPAGESETLVSSMARHTFGTGVVYYLIQASTAAILVLAANTSFADFPRLTSLIAADRFLPRQLANRGDRFVFSNGIIVLALLAGVLVVIFGGREQSMLPLYALGVFLSFTLSQAGMVVHWYRERKEGEAKKRIIEEEARQRTSVADDPGQASHRSERIAALDRDRGGNWILSMIINGLGALVTLVVLIVIAITKFTHGAWAVVLVIGLVVLMFRTINKHYRLVAAQLSLDGVRQLRELNHRVIVPISGVHRGVLPALRYARSICGEGTQVSALYIDVNPAHTAELLKQWEAWGMGIPLKVVESPYRSITEPLLNYIKSEAEHHEDSITTIVLPEFVTRLWWQQLLHNQTALMLKGRLLFERHIVVTSVPHHLRK
ncbi:MAG: amino acid permease-associated region [Chlorobi bacterium]|nr:amino acid permease-associated region [Chlorobiota bacterium]